jgi:hypothetical protein
MIHRANSQRWPIRDDARREIVARIEQAILAPNTSLRALIYGARLLKEMDEANQKQEQIDDARPEAQVVIIDATARSQAEVELDEWRRQMMPMIESGPNEPPN